MRESLSPVLHALHYGESSAEETEPSIIVILKQKPLKPELYVCMFVLERGGEA